jgi:glycolate oxidase
MTDTAAIIRLLGEVIAPDRLHTGDRIADDLCHDEALGLAPQRPVAVVEPVTTAEVAAVLRIADAGRVPVTARGSGTGLSGAAIPRPDGILVSFARMNRILEIDTANHVAVVQPGVTLAQLDEALSGPGLVYPVYPGEYSASVGGNIATNAGGMRAVKYGVTRHQVLGLEAVLASGDVIRTGGKYVKSSTGYDLTQLIVGSEGTLALVTEATLRLYPRAQHSATVMAPFATLEEIAAAVPRVVASGIGPLICEYIDTLTMAAATRFVGVDIGVPADVQSGAYGYLVVALEDRRADRLDEDVEALAALLGDAGAIDVYVLPPLSARQLIDAREKAFWVAKANNADDIVDVVVPRASIPQFMARVAAIAEHHGSWVAGCGHAGDGNVHLSVFSPDPERRRSLLRDLFEAGLALGGAISGEHGIGIAKRRYFLELEDPVKVALMRRIKRAFDPNGILNPGTIFDEEQT